MLVTEQLLLLNVTFGGITTEPLTRLLVTLAVRVTSSQENTTLLLVTTPVAAKAAGGAKRGRKSKKRSKARTLANLCCFRLSFVHVFIFYLPFFPLIVVPTKKTPRFSKSREGRNSREHEPVTFGYDKNPVV
jgi:hypothetical protein